MSVKTDILNYVRTRHYGGANWVPAGDIELAGTLERWGKSGRVKGSTIDRRCEELADERELDSQLEVDRSKGFKRYRIKEMFAHLK